MLENNYTKDVYVFDYTIYSVTMDQCDQDRKQNCRHSVFGKFPEKGTAMAWKQWYKEEGG